MMIYFFFLAWLFFIIVLCYGKHTQKAYLGRKFAFFFLWQSLFNIFEFFKSLSDFMLSEEFQSSEFLNIWWQFKNAPTDKPAFQVFFFVMLLFPFSLEWNNYPLLLLCHYWLQGAFRSSGYRFFSALRGREGMVSWSILRFSVFSCVFWEHLKCKSQTLDRQILIMHCFHQKT